MSGFSIRMSHFDIVPVQVKNVKKRRVGVCSECEDIVKIDPNDAASPHRDSYGEQCSGDYRQVERVFFACPVCTFTNASYYVYGKGILAHKERNAPDHWCTAGGRYVVLDKFRRVVGTING